MPMIFLTTKASSVVGIDGKAWWARAESSYPIPLASFRDLVVPGAVGFRAERASAHVYQGDLYMTGGLSHNMRLSKRFGFVIQGIRPPQNDLVNAAGSGFTVGLQASGTGLTADMIGYISFWDEDTNERSPLSEASPTISLSNQGIAWSNLPIADQEELYKIPGDTTANATTTITGTSTLWSKFVRIGDEIALSSAPSTFSKVLSAADASITVATALGDGTTQQIIVRRKPRWTHVELWRSVDGSLPRLVTRLQKGVTSYADTVATGSLGESFTEDFTRFPRCRYNQIWHDRQVMSGDEENPQKIYLSLIGFPERKSDIELETRNGEAVVGLGVVRDTLLVFCQTSTYVVSGYTEDDIQINMIQPNLGLVSNAAQANIHGDLWIATNLGPFRTDGSSWFPMNKHLKDAWTRDYADRPSVYEDCFAVHDEIRQVVKFYLGTHPRTNDDQFEDNRYTYLVADYTVCVPLENGEMGQPRWSFDVYRRAHDTAFLIAVPGGRRRELYSAACNGFFYHENQSQSGTDGSSDDREMLIVHPADFAGDHGGNFAHGKKFVDLDLFIETEDVACSTELYPGDEYAWPIELNDISPPFDIEIPAQQMMSGTTLFAPAQVQSFRLEGITGRSLTLALRQNPCGDLSYRGYQYTWVPGPAARRLKEETK